MLDGKVLEKVAKARLLGVTFDQHLQWNNHVNATISSVYSKLSILKKLKNFVNFKVRKLLAQSLLLSQIDFGDPVYSPISLKNMNKLQRLQRAVASFVYGRYVSTTDVIKLNWLPIKERREFNILKLVHKAIHDPNWPVINKIEIRNHNRILRGNNNIELQRSKISGNFQDTASIYFNNLPSSLRNITSFNSFCSNTRKYLFNCALARCL